MIEELTPLRACPHRPPQGTNPTYIWVPLHKPPRRRGSVAVGEQELSDLQVGGQGRVAARGVV